MRSLRVALVALLFAALTPILARGQGGAATITGTITDQSGAVIVGAQVTITDNSTKITTTEPTNQVGTFIFINVPPGHYDVKVTKSGFQNVDAPGQEVIVGQQLTLNLSMTVGAATQTVEVTAAPGAELQTMNSTMGTTLGGSTLLALPNANRDATSLLMFQPMTAPTFAGAEGNTTGGQVAGAMSDQNTFTLDGGNATDDLAGDNNYVAGNRSYVGPQAAIPTPVESIEEFKVATNNQTADFASSAGGQIMLVTKRGTNTWHGSGYDYFQADWLDAAGWNLNVSNLKPVKQHQNRFGGSLGGPITNKEVAGGKTFFYFNYEGRRWPQANGKFERTVPTNTMRQGILQFTDANGKVVSYNLAASTQCGTAGTAACDPRGIGLDPVISQLWNTYTPLPNDFAADGSCANGYKSLPDALNTCGYFGALSLPVKDNFAVVRIDHDFGSKWRFNTSYRYFQLQFPSTNQVDIGGLVKGDTKGTLAAQSSNPAHPRYAVAGLTGALTPTLTNDFHISYLLNDWNWIRYGVPNGLFGIPGGLEVDGETTNPLGPMNFDTQDARFRTWDGHDWTYADNLNWLKGKHFFQFGGTVFHWWDDHVRDDNVTGALSNLVYQINKGSGLHMTQNWRPPSCEGQGITANCLPDAQDSTWNTDYAMQMGFVGTASQLFVRGGSNFSLTGAPYLEDHSITDGYSMFFSDSFKIKSNLTVNYGLEWGVQMPPYELNGVQDYLTDSTGSPVSYQSYIDNVQTNALNGQVYNPVLGFEPIRGVGGHPKYPYAPFYGAFSPRVSIAWSPAFDSGFLNKVFGNKKTVIRGGYARISDRTNAVNNVLTPLLGYGFGQPIRCNGPRMDGVCTNEVNGTDPTNGFRIGVDGNTAPFPAVAQTLPIPAEPGINAAAASVLFALDNQYRPGLDDQIDFSIQREIPGQMIVEIGYAGRWAKHLYLGEDTDNAPVMLTLGGQSYAKAYYALWQANHSNTAAAPQPFFESALGGSAYCKGYSSCTAAVQANEGSAGTNNLGTEGAFGMFADIDGNWNFPGCTGCNILPSDSQEYAGLNIADTRGYANYQAGILTIQKRTGHGLTLSGNLTWSHSLNTIGINQEFVEDAPNYSYNLRSDYGPAPWDRRWTSNVLGSYELPFGKGKRFSGHNGIVDRVIGGWSAAPIWTWATGIPIETFTGNCQEFGGGYLSWCSGAVPTVNTGTFGHTAHLNVPNSGGYGVNLFANPAQVESSYRPALLGLDTRSYDLGPYYGQHRWNVDFTLAKATAITERVGTTFYAQFLNGFNHMMFSDPGMNLQGGGWGVISGQYNTPRTIELGLRVAF
ncbi:MAG: carboxypeptidase regulatory-like domain-containing protein [Terriglobia bacterium]